ncbi:MAG TPA: helix-turn-helix transcriptional regulator [Steroidobacteraceae bacterium]
MLGKAFKAERVALGLSQQAVAASAGARRQTIADLEAGRNVSVRTLFAALAALGKGLSIVDTRLDLDRIHLLRAEPRSPRRRSTSPTCRWPRLSV